MWWAWPHLRRIWAATGTVAAGMVVSYLYSLVSRQPLPDQGLVTRLLTDHRRGLGGGLVAFVIVSIASKRAYRRREARAPHPIRLVRRTLLQRLGGLVSRRKPGGVARGSAEYKMLVGRGGDMTKLRRSFSEVQAGSRRIVFVSGEPGIGKTMLVGAFLNSLGANGAQRIGRGQCVEQYGAGEPYMPILEALTRLCREPGGDELVESLHRLAPAWLAQMPSLVSAEDRAQLQGLAQGTTQQRMLREMAEALEVIAAEQPLVLLLEDLHWSDRSTLDLIAAVARRSEPARLMILGTYRPVEILAGEHPLRGMKEELELHQQCIELRLPLLSEADVATYIAQRFSPDHSRPSPVTFPPGERDLGKVAPAIYAHSEGNPLFMVNVIDYLVEQGSLADADKIEAPRTIRQMIERNLERLAPDEQRVLEAASVAGAEFSAAAVAAALERPIVAIEACCTNLARCELFVLSNGTTEWPDGTHAASYRFLHALYQQVLFERTPVARQSELHRAIAERLETAYGAAASEIAAELAWHFVRCDDRARALQYLELAGERATTRHAYSEAEQLYREAIKVVLREPESPDRDSRELKLSVALGTVMEGTHGFSAVETAAVYAHARALADRVGGSVSLRVYTGLWAGANTRGELRQALGYADQMLAIARGMNTPAALASAHYARGLSCYWLAQLIEAQKHLQEAVEHYHEGDFQDAFVDPGIRALSWLSVVELRLGYPERSVQAVRRAVEVARRQNHPYNLAFALYISGIALAFRGDVESLIAADEEVRKLSASFGFPLWGTLSKIRSAWTAAKIGSAEGVIESIEKGHAELDAMKFFGARANSLIMLCETQVISGAVTDARATVEKALMINPEELVNIPELLRLRGELRLVAESDDARFALVEQDFRQAIELSRGMSAKFWELRATTSLARLLLDTGRRDEARTMLAEIYSWFTEGFDTKDLKEAKALLDELTEASG